MTDLSPETVGKLVALARHAAVSARGHSQKLAQAIVAELPEPVDPDLVEARKVAAAIPGDDRSRSYAAENRAILAGECDHRTLVICALAAIKRGRALAGGDRS